jgi:hypothetical protein
MSITFWFFLFFICFVICWSMVNSGTWGLLYSASLDAGALVLRTWTEPPGAVGASQFVHSAGDAWRWAGLQQMSHVWCQLHSSRPWQNQLTILPPFFISSAKFVFFLPDSSKYRLLDIFSAAYYFLYSWEEHNVRSRIICRAPNFTCTYMQDPSVVFCCFCWRVKLFIGVVFPPCFLERQTGIEC